MSASDSVVDFSGIDLSLTIYDGSGNSLAIEHMQADGGWTTEGDTYTEGRTRGLHRATPVLRRTGSGNVTGSISVNVSSFKGSTAAKPVDVLHFSGLASGWTTTGAGDKKALRYVWTFNASAAGGATQTVTMAACVAMNIKFDPVGSDGLGMLSWDWTDHESVPVFA